MKTCIDRDTADKLSCELTIDSSGTFSEPSLVIGACPQPSIVSRNSSNSSAAIGKRRRRASKRKSGPCIPPRRSFQGLRRSPEERRTKFSRTGDSGSIEFVDASTRTPSDPNLMPGKAKHGLRQQNRPSRGHIAVPPALQEIEIDVPGDEEEYHVQMPRDGSPSEDFKLVEARLVEDHNVQGRRLSRAVFVDPQAIERATRQAQKERQCRGIGIGIILLAATILTLAIVLPKPQEQQVRSRPKEATPVPSLGINQTNFTNSTEIPSPILMGLPNYTLESLKDPLSPQSQALHWLANHKNIDFMADWRVKQLFAMATFYFSMNGLTWPRGIAEDWLDESRHECDWYSTAYGHFDPDTDSYRQSVWQDLDVCNDQHEMEALVVEITGDDEQKPRASNMIPPEISFLTSLRVIMWRDSVSTAPLSDFIPSELFHMTALKHLYVSLKSNERLPGPFPIGFHEMSSLGELELNGAHMTGNLPTQLGLISSLTSLSLYANDLTGIVPSELGRLSALEELSLRINFFEGSVPTELGLLANLSAVDLGVNLLSGPFPSALGSLKSLSSLELVYNFLTGSLPSQIGELSAMSMLGLTNNFFSGALPSELGRLESIKKLYLHIYDWSHPTASWRNVAENAVSPFGRGFQGPIPTELGLLSNLTVLLLQGNRLTGEVPEELCWLDQFESGGLEFDCSPLLCGCNCICT